jgi:hypothetical protein
MIGLHHPFFIGSLFQYPDLFLSHARIFPDGQQPWIDLERARLLTAARPEVGVEDRE